MDNWQSAWVESNGINIHYHRTGGPGPILLLIHGFTDNGLCWSRVARQLEANYDILMLDSRGHGLSDKPEKDYSGNDLAADIAGVLEALNLGSVMILGHSVGALTAVTVAAQYPELVCGLMLEDPIWRKKEKDPSKKSAAMTKAIRQQIVIQQQLSAQQIEASGREDCPTWDPEEFPAWVQAKQQVSPDVAEMLSFLTGNWQAVAATIQCPTLLITGDPEKDVVVSPAIAAEAQLIISQMQHVNIAHAGHNIRRENFQPYLLAVSQFMDSLIAH